MEIRSMQCDVLVIGGGPGGLPAAIAAARQGASVIIVERNGHLGGNAVMGLPWLGFLSQHGRQIIGGIAQEFVDDLGAKGHSFGHSRCPMHNSITLVHPEMFKLLALQKCVDQGIKILFHSEVVDAVVNNGKLTQVSVMGKGTRIDIKADVFIDATGDGDLAFIAGARYEKGSSKTGMLQPPTVMFSLSNFNEEKFFKFLEENPENMEQLETVIVDEGYNTKLWRSTPNHVFVGMKAYLDKLRKTTDCKVLRENIIYINSTVKGKIYINTVRVPGTDGSDIESLSNAEIEGHLQIPAIYDMLRSYVPGFENCELDSISPSIGVRESRRFNGVGKICVDEALRGYKADDTIALAGYKIDIHNGNGQGTILMKVEEPYGIPMSATISSDIDGLLFSGRCISMDHETLGSMRIMPTCMAIGQGVGTLAAYATANKISVRDVDYKVITESLLKQGAILK